MNQRGRNLNSNRIKKFLGIKNPCGEIILGNPQLCNLESHIGYLLNGKFYCLECAEKYTGGLPEKIKVYEINIRPYSQCCIECDKIVVDGLKKHGTNEPLELFT